MAFIESACPMARSDLSPLAGRGRNSRQRISGEGVQVFQLIPASESPPHPNPLRASFARLDPACGARGCTSRAEPSQPHFIILYTALVSAPSMIRLVPDTRLATGLARKTTPAATSCAVPIRPVGL